MFENPAIDRFETVRIATKVGSFAGAKVSSFKGACSCGEQEKIVTLNVDGNVTIDDVIGSINGEEIVREATQPSLGEELNAILGSI